MIVRIDKSFQKDVSKISDQKIKQSIAEIVKDVQQTESLLTIKNLKKLTGYKDFYRIRLGDYRIGLRYTENQELIFIRFLNRKDIYKRWP
jgi:mRNA interferase RelE/StbE